MSPHRRELLAPALGAVVLPAQGMVGARRQLFGSPVDLLLPAATPAAVRDEVLQGLATMNARWNAWKPGDLTALNRAFAAGRSTTTTPALVAMIRATPPLETASFGFFNPALGGLVGARGFHDDDLRPGSQPSPADLARWRAAPPCLAQIEIRGPELRSTNAALQLDFGAYAKWVALDWALARLRRRGIHDALLNLGGNLAATGRADGRPWRVGIRDPFGPGWPRSSRPVRPAEEAVVTSGSCERWRLLDGERCSHILDPGTGAPAPALASVTVLHRSAALADAAATALLVAGPARWRAVAERMGIDQVLLIDRQGRQQASARLAPRLHRS